MKITFVPSLKAFVVIDEGCMIARFDTLAEAKGFVHELESGISEFNEAVAYPVSI